MKKAVYHLPGLFEFYEFYRVFLPLCRRHREYFYDWCTIGSIYGAPDGCLWGGGRTGCGDAAPGEVLALMREYGISARLTFSNSLLRAEHLADRKCNALCAQFEAAGSPQNGVIVSSDLLAEYLQVNYPGLYLVSSTTKVLTEFQQLRQELDQVLTRIEMEAGTAPGYVPLCGAGFPPEQSLCPADAAARSTERQSGVPLQRVLLAGLQRTEALL